MGLKSIALALQLHWAGSQFTFLELNNSLRATNLKCLLKVV